MTSAIHWGSVHRRLAQSARALERSYDEDPERRETLLRERAVFLRNRQRGGRHAAATKVLTFTLADERYALPLLALVAVLPRRVLGSLPGHTGSLLGVLYERATLWPVYDLRAEVGLKPCDPGDSEYAFILIRDPIHRLAYRVDRVEGIRALDSSLLARTSVDRGNPQEPTARPVIEDGLILLDASSLLHKRSFEEDLEQ